MNDINIDAMIQKLREDHRIKINCDYAFTIKYGEIHLLCHHTFLDSIKEVAENCGVTFTTIHTY
jgi:hypothetical protein